MIQSVSSEASVFAWQANADADSDADLDSNSEHLRLSRYFRSGHSCAVAHPVTH